MGCIIPGLDNSIDQTQEKSTRPIANNALNAVLILFALGYLLAPYIVILFEDEMISEETSPTGAIYYVAKIGNDSNSGTEAHPWLTIQKAADTLVAGDTVYVKSGIYNEQVTINNSGSHGKYITFAVHPGHLVIIEGTGTSPSAWIGQFHINLKNYIKISGFRIINAPQAGIHADYSNNIIIENNYIDNPGLSAIKIGWGKSSNITINNNIINRPNNVNWEEAISVSNAHLIEIKNNHVLSNGRGEGIDLKDGTTYGKVYNNHVENVTSTGIYIDAYADYEHSIDIFQNIIHDAGYQGLAVSTERGGIIENISFYNNIVYNNKMQGISISNFVSSDSLQPGKVSDIKIINNIFYKNGNNKWGGGIDIGLAATNTSKVAIRNNIVSKNTKWQILVRNKTSVTNVVIDHNLIDGFRNYTDEERGSNYVDGDPHFENPEVFDFHLKRWRCSPAIDKGSPDGAPGVDFDGKPRPLGEGYDIGAFEYEISKWCYFLSFIS